MNRFVTSPNAPEGEVTALICGGLNKTLRDYFHSENIEILYTEKNIKVDSSVSEHSDLSALYLGGGRIIIDRGQPMLISILNEKGFSVTETVKSVGGLYPDDCILNHTIIGRYIIGNSKIFDESVNNECENLEVIHTNQGYCKCSVLVIDEKSLITDDESIASESQKKGIDSLLIRKGDITLNGHEYGFIGGASGKISSSEVVFFGDVTKHRDYNKIRDFIYARGMKIISFDFPLTDFGGFIPIKENIL
ncbi:MAG: hypothetical protein IJN88_02690 [Clostridia bacterium]|nr:hypothetical protein [Clostridia bacterium]